MPSFPDRWISLRRLILLTVITILGVLAISTAGCGEEETDSDTTEATTIKTSARQERVATDEYVQELAVRRIGDPELVRVAQVTETDGQKFVKVDIDRPYTCHDGAVVGEVALFTQQVMGMLFQDPAVAQIDIAMYGSTQEVADKDEIAMTVTVDRVTSDAIDWFDFDHTNMLQLVTAYYMHPNIEQSYLDEGGSTEGTLDQLEQQGALPTS